MSKQSRLCRSTYKYNHPLDLHITPTRTLLPRLGDMLR